MSDKNSKIANLKLPDGSNYKFPIHSGTIGPDVIDVKNLKSYFWVFKVFGTNSIFLFILSGLWTKTILKIKFNFSLY